MRGVARVSLTLCLLFGPVVPAAGLDRPWIGDVFFHWYTWDYDRELGSWLGGIHNTPLGGYYDSRTVADNRRSLWLASEWGMTHHFMDYWSPDWKGEGGRMREAVVMEAAESLRRAGYDVWMSYYQDGSNFAMREFSRNVSEKRDVYQWLRDFAASEVWPKIEGRPVQLVYARNGQPRTTLDHEGFRRFLRERFENVAALNAEWNTQFGDFDEIGMDFHARGHQRAASIEYQYRIWQEEWERLNERVREEFELPGMRASFDVGYGPYLGFGFSGFARVLGGPHSYAGIFAAPHDQDAQRFIQAAVAKKHGTVFFDHLKNYYFDWDIRVPGAAYLPDPFHFDRFWTGALARYSEALLHLSWNEWWEGSNLEPCREFGKTYCEKNLFYATLMKLAFPSIRDAGQGAPVALLLNDWRFASGAAHEEELYATVQTLRRLGVPFDLLPDDLVTPQRLEGFRLVVAPAYGCGLGYNRNHQPIGEMLAAWLKQDGRRLIVSAHPSVAEMCGLRKAGPPSKPAAPPGEDLNVYVDVGAEGDEKFLEAGRGQRETGMRAEEDVTFRWTPVGGDETTLVFPSSPNRDHVLRLRGNAIWPNRLKILVNGIKAAAPQVPAGEVRLEVPVPAAAIGSAPMVRLRLCYEQRRVPAEQEPRQYPNERRVCNLSINNIQWSTANVPADTRDQRYAFAEDSVRLAGEVFGQARGAELPVPFSSGGYYAAPEMEVLSVRRLSGAARDIALAMGPSRVLFVDGRLSEIESESYWLPLLRGWAGVEFARFAVGPECMAARLRAGDTEFVVCFNQDVRRPRRLQLSIPAGAAPLCEARVLSRDGQTHLPLQPADRGKDHRAVDTLQYYGVYQFAFSPVALETPELVLQPGQAKSFAVRVRNLTEREVRGEIRAAAVIPTITGQRVAVELQPAESKHVSLPIQAATTADWGRKTVYVLLEFDGRRAVVLRDLIVEKPTDVELGNVILHADRPRLEVRVPENPYGRTAPLAGARLTFRGQSVDLPRVEAGGRCLVSLAPAEVKTGERPELQAETLRIDAGGPRPPIRREVFLATRPESRRMPPDALAAVVVFNARSQPLKRELVAARIPGNPPPCSVRSKDGRATAAQLDASGWLSFLADVPARSARTFLVCPAESQPATDLRCSCDGLGTGRGTLSVENSHLSITLAEAAGGTVTSLRSRATGRDYGLQSFGIHYGTFSRHDPTQPRTDTVRYIHEDKTCQEDSPGRIELLSKGPVAVVARVRWSDERVRVRQTYEFRAEQPVFLIRQRVEPMRLGDQQELVAFNARFRPNRLSKTYPNFVGLVNEKEQPHFGWRRGTWVPDYATLMTPPEFDESLSLIIARQDGLVGIRQGFWPRNRPRSGRCHAAQIELLGDRTAGCDAEILVFLHPGHQVVAKRLWEDLRRPPEVIAIGTARQP